MNKITNNIIYGFSLVLFGIAILLDKNSIISLGNFWGMFLFIPGIIALVLNGASFFNTSITIIGIGVVLSSFFDGSIVLPLIFILVGILIMTRDHLKKGFVNKK